MQSSDQLTPQQSDETTVQQSDETTVQHSDKDCGTVKESICVLCAGVRLVHSEKKNGPLVRQGQKNKLCNITASTLQQSDE